MKKLLYILFVTSLLVSCNFVISQPLPTITPAPSATSSPLPTARATGTAEAETEQAEVRGVVVNVRSSPAGAVVGQVYSGQPVDVLGCREYEDKGRWCEIEAGALSGFIYEGCLNTESGLLCQAAE
jgi:hypothetical protein